MIPLFAANELFFGWLQQQFPLILLTFAAPLLLLAWSKKVFPHWSLLLAIFIAASSTFFLLNNKDAIFIVFLCDIAVVIFAGLDLFTLPRHRYFSVERETMKVASLRQNHRVNIRLNNHANRTVVLRLRDDTPPEFTANPAEFEVTLTPRSRTTLSYDVKAGSRGEFHWHSLYLEVRSRWSFWKRYMNYQAETVIQVYPDMQQLAQYAILARTNRLSLLGVRRTRKIGTDNEFERLRDYTLDDNYKHIDWRSTARRNKLTVKDFQTSQSQRIIFMLDCGRMMTNLCNGLSLLDHSLNAMLMLSYIALKQGDSVGLVCFSDTVHAFIPPAAGMNQTNHLLHAMYNRFPTLVESRYDQAFLYLNTHCKKRSLVVLITNVIDEVNAHQIQSYLRNLVGRHLPLGLLLRDHRLFDAADLPLEQPHSLFHAAAAAEILTWRHQVLSDLEHAGVFMLDLFPEDMTAPLINTYLDMKARHLL